MPSKSYVLTARWRGLGNELTQVAHPIVLLRAIDNTDGNVNSTEVEGHEVALFYAPLAVWVCPCGTCIVGWVGRSNQS